MFSNKFFYLFFALLKTILLFGNKYRKKMFSENIIIAFSGNGLFIEILAIEN